MQQISKSKGPGDYAALPIEVLLDHVKEDLKDATTASPTVESAATTCELILQALRDCLPPDHEKKIPFTAKALNRRGDTLLLLGRADEALEAYNTALPLTPDDSYILYNRGRAHLALGSTDAAKADFTEAASTNKRVALLIAVLALFLALSDLGGGNADNDAVELNVQSANFWAFYQAKTIRRTSTLLAAEEMETRLPEASPEARARRRTADSGATASLR